MPIVDTCWGPREIGEQPYWHIVGPYGYFNNNVRVGKGALPSVSAGIEGHEDLQNAHSPYSMARRDDPKELEFENIRSTAYPDKPSRFKTLYVFDDYSLVERACSSWFVGTKKNIHECRIIVGAKTHKADTSWLNCIELQWQSFAHQYWSGTMTANSFPEVLVHGALYFPGWATLPVE